MSNYKPLYSSIWTDNQFENYSPEKKLLFIFLLTNQYVEKSGIYKVSIRQIAFNTGLINEVINEVINELINEGKIMYDFTNGIIFIKSVFKYQKGMIKNENILILTMKRNYELVKTEFWNFFFDIYSNDDLINKIKLPLIDGSLMAHQLYINKNKNKNKNNGKEGVGEKPKANLEKPKETQLVSINNFETFWSFYTPVAGRDGKSVDKGNKADAKKSYEKAIALNFTHETIMQALEFYLKECQKNARFTKHAVSWLNQAIRDEFKFEQSSVIQSQAPPQKLNRDQEQDRINEELLKLYAQN